MQKKVDLSTNVQFLHGVGPVRARSLSRLGINCVDDLLMHFPRTWLDRSSATPISKLVVDSNATVCGEVLTSGGRTGRGRKSIQSVTIGDQGGVLTCTWFGQPYITKQLQTGMKVLVSGKVQLHNSRPQLVHPDFEVLTSESTNLHSGRLVPVYPLTSGIGQHWLRGLTYRTLEQFSSEITEFLPRTLLQKHKLQNRRVALQNMHFPEDETSRTEAQKRFIYEEIAMIQALMGLRKSGHTASNGIKLHKPGDLTTRLVKGLPFQLTSAQRTVLGEILRDMRSGVSMHRLLQGDVGSGKTLVALLAALFVIEQGWQATIMAPTEVLARQHGESISKLIEPLGISMEVLTGSTPSAQRKKITAGAGKGEIDLLVGTHALLGEDVYIPNLGLAVVDEQHRFGVIQRGKASEVESSTPHVLVMSATPIPRSLSLTLYGDLDLSLIDELPPGRKPIQTDLIQPTQLDSMHELVCNRVKNGQQAYVIYPVIEETEGQDIKSATEEFEKLSQGEFSDFNVALLHGRIKGADKAKIMSRFAAGEIDILIATTVIEVGVDVANSTTMIIHHPERFGLAQLHQLRGRVGRGELQSWCHLVLDKWVAPESFERIRFFASTCDGFKLAEEDLRRRGPGDIMGVRQHGLPTFSVANPIRDAELVKLCSQDIKELLDADPRLNSEYNRAFKNRIENSFKKLFVHSAG